MASFNVSPTMLREKARIIRTLLEESQSTHQQLWSQISTQATVLPRGLTASHIYANRPWNNALNKHYANYYQLALRMEAAADAYERGDHDIQNLFDSF
jgi:uncharacterized protein YukE